MASLAAFLHGIGLLLYGGPLLAFAVLLPLGSRIKGLSAWQVDRLWRAWAPGSGLAMAVLILGGVVRYFGLVGDLAWWPSEPVQRVFLVKHGLFLLVWVNYLVTEVWIAEPLRRLDPGPDAPADLPAYHAARRRLIRHLWGSAALVVAILAISSVWAATS